MVRHADTSGSGDRLYLGALLREYRERAMLTQEELAEQSGLSVGTIRNLESGRIVRPRITSVRALASVLRLADREYQVLVAAARDTVPAHASNPPDGGRIAPRQLPADVAPFTGRADELDVLDSFLREAEQPRRALVVAIDGSAGAGKTALAVHWAHRLERRFPDGQLFLDLMGYAASPALTQAEALGRLIHSLGGPPTVPTDVDAAAAQYRSLLADRRILVVLDNAADVDQVRPLLPGARGCVVVVTSRNRLDGLIAHQGAQRIGLDVLPAGEAGALLASMLGHRRTDAEPDSTAELARLCGFLPLALRVAAANLILRPHQRITTYVQQLRDRDRLATLAAAGDPKGAVAAAFDLSYMRLPPRERRMFRLLSLVPEPDVTAPAAAALAGVPGEQAAETLDCLARAHLVEEASPGRYSFHDLLNVYSGDRLRREETDAQREAAAARLRQWYQRADDSAAADVASCRAGLAGPDLPAATDAVPRSGHAAVLPWFVRAAALKPSET